MDGKRQARQTASDTKGSGLGRRQLMAGAGVSALALRTGSESAAAVSEGKFTGPLVGHVDTSSARVWLRPGTQLQSVRGWECEVQSDGQVVARAEARLDADHDYTVVFDLAGLTADTAYRFRISPSTKAGRVRAVGEFRTPPDDDKPARVTLGVGSCAPSKPSHVWTRIVQEDCQGFVFLGDTPYVDTTDLSVARQRHRTFLEQPEIAQMIASRPCWGTWDDHDFGLNDGHGDFQGKHVGRLAFTEYRANASFGQDPTGRPQAERFGPARGIHTSFRWGPIEVFLIDPRWFSRTEASWADPTRDGCIGKAQWDWLRASLKASRAPFKALATGMIWDDKKNSEKDDWHTYAHERDAIFDFIRDQKIDGCFLLGGDIHVSRALNYGPRCGYELWQFIVSPLHDSTIASLDVPHPKLVHHALEPHVFLKLVADTTVRPATLSATWINRDGKRIFQVETNSDELAATRR
jgi:phosphodiesterase/alkaline phosphatase D-like protein